MKITEESIERLALDLLGQFLAVSFPDKIQIIDTQNGNVLREILLNETIVSMSVADTSGDLAVATKNNVYIFTGDSRTIKPPGPQIKIFYNNRNELVMVNSHHVISIYSYQPNPKRDDVPDV